MLPTLYSAGALDAAASLCLSGRIYDMASRSSRSREMSRRSSSKHCPLHCAALHCTALHYTALLHQPWIFVTDFPSLVSYVFEPQVFKSPILIVFAYSPMLVLTAQPRHYLTLILYPLRPLHFTPFSSPLLSSLLLSSHSLPPLLVSSAPSPLLFSFLLHLQAAR